MTTDPETLKKDEDARMRDSAFLTLAAFFLFVVSVVMEQAQSLEFRTLAHLLSITSVVLVGWVAIKSNPLKIIANVLGFSFVHSPRHFAVHVALVVATYLFYAQTALHRTAMLPGSVASLKFIAIQALLFAPFIYYKSKPFPELLEPPPIPDFLLHPQTCILLILVITVFVVLNSTPFTNARNELVDGWPYPIIDDRLNDYATPPNGRDSIAANLNLAIAVAVSLATGVLSESLLRKFSKPLPANGE